MRQIRNLEAKDLSALLALSAEAGWNQTGEDWALLLKLAPETCFGIEGDGQIVSTTTLVCYGKELAWLGMVLTLRSYQRQQFARRLLEHALAVADRLGIETIRLDATDQGQPIYERMGFQVEGTICRWSGELPCDVGSDPPRECPPPQLDRQVFGAERRKLLAALAEHSRSFLEPRGFAFSRPGLNANYLGPCVAENIEIAASLIRSVLREGGRWYWDILAENREAEALARELGFTVVRTLTRMRRGMPHAQDNLHMYAIAGFELG